MHSPIKRRAFLASSSALVVFVLARCRKDAVVKPLINPPNISAVPGSTSYLAQYSATEVATGLVTEPTYISQIKCYTDNLTYFPGDTVTVFLSGPKNENLLIAFADVNRKPIFSFNTPMDRQPIGSPKPWLDGLNYKETIKVKLPTNLKSGIYQFTVDGRVIGSLICKSTRTNNDITIVYPTNTDNAYNMEGGKSVYQPEDARSTVASFSRAVWGVADHNSSFLEWMSKQPYDTRYLSDADLDDYTQIQDTKIIIIPGHSEYWTRAARKNIDKFIDSGKNVLFLSGNTMYFQVRYKTAKNLMICYKDKNLDPLGDTIYSTIFWTDPHLKYSVNTSIGVDFDGGGYGTQLPNRWNGYKIVNEKSPLFEGTGIKNGDVLTMPTLEYDGAPVVKMISPGSSEIPVIDNTVLNFYKVELLGYDFAISFGKKGLGTFIVFKKTKNSGTVVNVASTDWCADTAFNGVDGKKIIKITQNMIDKALAGDNLFSS